MMQLRTDRSSSNTSGIQKTAYLGLLTAVAILFGYIETLLPFSFGIPGIKLGLTNIVTVLVLYLFNWRSACVVMLARVLVVGFLFGNAYGILYSLSGAVLSLFGMCLVMHCKEISMVGVSITGGILHNIGQLLVAALVVKELRLSYYAPILIIAGTLTGLLIGMIAALVYKHIAHALSSMK